MCGKEFDMWDEQENFRFEHRVGYGSVHDGEYIKINLCCDCFDKVIDMVAPLCKTNPVKENQCDFEITSIDTLTAFNRETNEQCFTIDLQSEVIDTKINNGG
jgi:hypothetical protein